LIACGKELQTLGPIGADSEDGLRVWSDEWKGKVKPGLALVLETHDHASKLDKSFAYAATYDAATDEWVD
jgi:hypothetical protein